MSICPRCNSEKTLIFGDDPAPYVRCMDCKEMYIPQNGPTSHETLKQILDAIVRIEEKLDRLSEPGERQYVPTYDDDQIWSAFECYSGASHWPSDDPKDSPYDTFRCRECGKEFRLLMAGSRYLGSPTFEEDALKVLRNHMETNHPKKNGEAESA